MAHISELTPRKGERVITFGGTRAGKSSLTDMTMMQVQSERPSAMQILVDTKPRYRAAMERGRRYTSRKPAAYRYESWEAGPTIPNSCLVDIWDEHPFKGMWEQPGEVAIMQGAEFDDWRRMLQLLKGFVNAQIKGRERRIIVDECLDFINATRSELIHETTCCIAPRVPVRNVESELTLERIGYTVYPRSFSKWLAGSIYFISAPIRICATYAKSASKMPQVPREIGYSGSMKYSREELCQSHSQGDLLSLTGILHSCRIRKRNGGSKCPSLRISINRLCSHSRSHLRLSE